MKGPTYLIKRVVVDREMDRQLDQHLKRIQRINSQPSQIGKILNKNQSQTQQMTERANMNRTQSTTFRSMQKKRQQLIENQALLNQLLDISDGKYSMLTSSQSKPNNSNKSFMGTIESQNYSNQSVINKQGGSGLAGGLNSLHVVQQKKQQQRIAIENQYMAQRMIRLPPVINFKKFDKVGMQQQQLSQRIQKFRVPKKSRPLSYDQYNQNGSGNGGGSGGKGKLGGYLNGDGTDGDYGIQDLNNFIDENNQEMMDQRVHMLIQLQQISFINFLPVNSEDEKYFLEIKASIRAMRKTNPETYDDFSQSVINEYFKLSELRRNQMMYVGIWQIRGDDKQRFLGDFEIDLTPYYLSSSESDVHLDLRNYKEMYSLPSYMPKDMRKKGWIDFQMKVRSHIQTYLAEFDPGLANQLEQNAKAHPE